MRLKTGLKQGITGLRGLSPAWLRPLVLKGGFPQTASVTTCPPSNLSNNFPSWRATSSTMSTATGCPSTSSAANQSAVTSDGEPSVCRLLSRDTTSVPATVKEPWKPLRQQSPFKRTQQRVSTAARKSSKTKKGTQPRSVTARSTTSSSKL